jgi:hypothetical protein
MSLHVEAADPKVVAPPLAVKPVIPSPAAAQLGGPKLGVPAPAIYCADPSVTAINFDVISRDPARAGRDNARVTAVARNLGKDLFEAGMLTLYAQMPGVADRELAHVDVPTLAPGAEVRVSYEARDIGITMSITSPPTFKAMFIVEPDAATGDRPSHRDCNPRNNEKSRSGRDMFVLFL